MPFVAPITIGKTIERIREREYVLPAIQREFVWHTEQIEFLFNSLMRGYPIGTFLFWSIEEESIEKFQFYQFLDKYHEKDKTHNEEIDVRGKKPITAILDGQQRLTSLYIGLLGSYAYKTPWKRWDNTRSYPERELYLNLLKKPKESERKYDFKFLTKGEFDESKEKDDEKFWFKVKGIMKSDELYKANDYLNDNDLNTLPQEQKEFSSKAIYKLWKVIHKEELINFFLEKEQSLDRVLNIFIRVNSKGTQLSYSDLLLSVATATWQRKDASAREIITKFVDDLNKIRGEFGFNKDFVLKSCLVLSDIDITFKVDNFNSNNIHLIEGKWDEISEAIQKTVELASSFGFKRNTLTSKYALIPIAYYLLKTKVANFTYAEKYRAERDEIFKWLHMVLLKRTFSGQSDSVLRSMRLVIRDHHTNGFPLQQISDSLKRKTTRSIIFTNDEIKELLETETGSYTFSSLAAVYPTLDFNNQFHQDHIFPKKLFEDEELLRKRKIPELSFEFYRKYGNSLANLQLLEKTENQEKSGKDFEDWLNEKDEQKRKDYMEKHFIPQGISLSLDNFKEFIEKRKKLLYDKLSELLTI